MKTMYDVMQLLKAYGVFVYTGDRELDLEMMEEELRDLYRSQMITPEDFSESLLILRGERKKRL